MPAKYKLYYFDKVRGRVEFIRYIFAYGNEPYEEVLFTREEWFEKVKKDMPFGVIPVLEFENGLKLSQSLAIGRYLASKVGLLSKDEFENAWGDQIIGAIEDLYRPYFRPYVVALYAKDEAKMKETFAELEKNGIIPLFDRLEKLLAEKTWFCGKNVHWSDLYVAELVDRLDTTYHRKDLLNKYPKLVAHSKRVHEIPNIKKYVETRKPTLI